MRFGAFELDPLTGELQNAESKVRLQPQPLKVLLALLNSPGELVSREQLKTELLPDALYGDPDHAINLAVTKLRSALQDSAEQPQFIETLPRRGYRFIAPVEIPPIDSGTVGVAGEQPPTPSSRPEQGVRYTGEKEAAVDLQESSAAAGFRKFRTIKWIAAALVICTSLIALSLLLLPRRSAKLTNKDTVMLAAFTNTTGDPVFDSTLRQGLSAHLQQSPFLNLLSDERIAQELSLMTQPKGTQLTNELAREVCQRTASAAVIEGSIAKLGNQFVLHLRTLNCHSGELLAEEQVTADGKEQVLKSLGRAATSLRAKLGERLPSIKEHSAPPEDVTTPSLEALQAYSRGIEAMSMNDYTAAVMLFQQAISLDQNFVMAYAELGTAYSNLGQTERGADNLRKAYALREHVSGREKLYIESHYAQLVQGNLETARKIYTSWMQLYPRDLTPITNLAVIYMTLGYYDKTIPLHEEALRRDRGTGIAYVGLVWALVYVGRLDQAKAIAQEAVARADTPELHRRLYKISFLEHDAPGMERELRYLMGVPGYSDVVASLEADTASYFGQFAKARALTRRAADTALLADNSEAAAAYYSAAAVREALVGNAEKAKQQAQAALMFANSRYVEAESGIALALAGESIRADGLAGDLAQRFPEDTVIQFNLLPSIRSAIALRSGNGSDAIEVLVPAEPYDLATNLFLVDYYPVYLRGQAYLATHQGARAAAEFQKIHDHRSVLANTPLGALAYLGTGRACALAGDIVKARAAYQEFLTLWRDADPDTPLLKEAKAEYVKLH